MELLLLSMLLLGPATALKAESGKQCTDLSSWSAVVWQEGTSPCCLTKIIEPECLTTPNKVCVELDETICEIEVVEECRLTPCDVEVTMPGQEEQEYEPNTCKEEMVDRTITKTRPVEVEKVRTECDTIWDTDESGEMVWAGEENCIESKYIDYVFEEYEITVQVRESMCSKLPPIKYLTCTNMTITQPQLCSTCEPRAVAKCEVKTRTACQEVVNTTCKPQINTECNVRNWEPDQTLTHKKRCTGENSGALARQGDSVADAKTEAEAADGEAEAADGEAEETTEDNIEDTLVEGDSVVGAKTEGEAEAADGEAEAADSEAEETTEDNIEDTLFEGDSVVNPKTVGEADAADSEAEAADGEAEETTEDNIEDTLFEGDSVVGAKTEGEAEAADGEAEAADGETEETTEDNIENTLVEEDSVVNAKTVGEAEAADGEAEETTEDNIEDTLVEDDAEVEIER